MRNHNLILIAVILSGSFGFGYALVSAQRSSGGAETGGTLASQSEEPSTPGSAQKLAPSSHEIKRAEQALKVQGFNPGRIDGKIDSETKEALREFQKRNDLAVTGDLDKETAEKLGVHLGVDNGSSGQQPGKKGSTPPAKEFSPQGRLQKWNTVERTFWGHLSQATPVRVYRPLPGG